MGFKARAYLNNTNETLIWQADKDCVINLRYANNSGVDNNITISISPSASSGAAPADMITPATRIRANGIVEDTGIPVSQGEKIFGKAAIAGIAVRVMGPT